MGLVVSIVKSLRPPNATEYEEYIQLGRIGLWKAIRKHDPKLAKLSTIAWDYIRWEIIRYINKSVKYNTLMNNPDAQYRLQCVHSERTQELFTDSVAEAIPSSLSKSECIVVDMRHQGYTFEEIGKELGGYTRGWANKLFKLAIKKIQDANEN